MKCYHYQIYIGRYTRTYYFDLHITKINTFFLSQHQPQLQSRLYWLMLYFPVWTILWSMDPPNSGSHINSLWGHRPRLFVSLEMARHVFLLLSHDIIVSFTRSARRSQLIFTLFRVISCSPIGTHCTHYTDCSPIGTHYTDDRYSFRKKIEKILDTYLPR